MTYNELPARVAEGVSVLRVLWPSHDGPAHIVIADYNLRDRDLSWCIGEINAGRTYSNYYEASHPIFAATRAALVWLLENTTEEERTSWDVYP